jgi:thiosulfate/3-mercaptopyruvate sulfurtransferase
LYDQGHIENAIRFHWRDDLQDGVIRDLISKEKFEALLSKSGISNDTTVILYGGNNNWFATYALWYFKVYGHQDVRLLDGGRKRWELDGRPFVTEVPIPKISKYVAKERDNSIRAYRDEVIAAIGKENIVDVRSPAEFSGELAAPAHLPQEGGQVKGHIPTAKNIPWSKAANEDGTFKSESELKEIYVGAGVDLSKDTIAYCRIGERSAFSWFVLHELLGIKNVKNYDGSWTEYGSLVGVPVAVGA